MPNKYTSLWYAIFKKGDDIPFECFASEKVALDQANRMNWAHNSKDYVVKKVHIELQYGD